MESVSTQRIGQAGMSVAGMFLLDVANEVSGKEGGGRRGRKRRREGGREEEGSKCKKAAPPRRQKKKIY
jgi:hypothetical protein